MDTFGELSWTFVYKKSSWVNSSEHFFMEITLSVSQPRECGGKCPAKFSDHRIKFTLG